MIASAHCSLPSVVVRKTGPKIMRVAGLALLYPDSSTWESVLCTLPYASSGQHIGFDSGDEGVSEMALRAREQNCSCPLLMLALGILGRAVLESWRANELRYQLGPDPGL